MSEGEPQRVIRRLMFRNALAAGAAIVVPDDHRAASASAEHVPAPPAAGPLPARLDGSFIQLWRRHFSWTIQDWAGLLDACQSLHLSTLVVQWSRLDGLRFDRPLPDTRLEDSPLGRMVRSSLGRPLKVVLGLCHDTGWWRHPQLEGTALEQLLRTWVDCALEQARAVRPLARAIARFDGWYLTEEIDVRSWSAAHRFASLRRALERLCDGLERLTPGAPLAISGFGDHRDSPSASADFWVSLCQAVPRVDRLLLQDGLGVGHYTPDQWTQTFAAVTAGLSRHPRRAALWAVVEAFRAQSGAGEAFRARPATMPELHAQLRSTTNAARRIAFSVPDYMVPSAGPAAEQLYEDYRRATQPVSSIGRRIQNRSLEPATDSTPARPP